MLRDKNLVPLSHQHQHALALCVDIERSLKFGDAPLTSLQDRIQNAFNDEIDSHFQAEEQVLFPAADTHDELHLLVSELLAEHTMLRSYRYAAMAFSMTPTDLLDFAAALSAHIRKEERELFERMQQLSTPDQLATIGSALQQALDSPSQTIRRNSAQSSS